MNFKKFHLKWKIVKYFARSKQQVTLRNYPASSHPTAHQIKPYYVSETKIFLRRYLEIHRHLLSKCFKNAVLERQEMVHAIFFLTPNKNMIALKFVKSEIFLNVLREHIIFNIKWVEVHKMSDAVWAKLYCKMCDLFC